MTEMERDIYNRAAAHYMKKHDVLRSHMILKEFWDDYFDGNDVDYKPPASTSSFAPSAASADSVSLLNQIKIISRKR